MGEFKYDGLVVPGQVVLARELPFKIGKLEVVPAVRQLVCGARRQTVEPRVMQVLVVLARANGGIVTRDELIEICWAGRIVTDNAINRVISRVRQIATDFCPGCFKLETITKVGYRLAVAGSQPPAILTGIAASSSVVLGRRLMLGSLGATVAAGVGGIWLWRARQVSPVRLQSERLVRKGIETGFDILPESEEQARTYFREAIRIDPTYAEAWGQLAAAEDDGGRSYSAARRALQLDPDNAAANVALLRFQPYFGHWANYEADCRRLIGTYPSMTRLYFCLGALLSDVGRWRDAAEAFSTVVRKDYYRPVAHYRLVHALWSAGQIQDAEDSLQRALQIWPRHSALWTTRVRMLMFGGRPRDAIAMMDDSRNRPFGSEQYEWAPVRATALALATGSSADIGVAVASNLEASRRNSADIHSWAANLAAVGALDNAFALCEGYFRARGPWATMSARRQNSRATLFLFYPWTASLRSDPRFGPMVREIGLEDYWRAVGTGPDYRRLG